MPGKIEIGNIRDFLVPNPSGKGRHAEFPDEAHVWVGRAAPRWGLKASPLANPHKEKVVGREAAVGMFRADLHFWVQRWRATGFDTVSAPPMRIELDRLRALHAKHGKLVLVCCCETWDGEGKAPGLCHAEVVLEELLREAQ